MRNLPAAVSISWALLGTACHGQEPPDQGEPAPLVAGVVWDLAEGCVPEQAVGLGARVIFSCRSYGEAPRSRVVDASTGETLADWTYDHPRSSYVATTPFVIAATDQGGFAIAVADAHVDYAGGAFLFALEPDASSSGPPLEIAALAALPRFEDGRRTFLSAPLEAGNWSLAAFEDGEVTTLLELELTGKPLGRAPLAHGFGILHQQGSALMWSRFDAAGEALGAVELTSSYDPDFTFARARLVQGSEELSVVINTEEGVRWFGFDDEGVLIASPEAFKPHDRSEGVALAPLPDGALVLATTERDGLDDFFSMRLLEDHEIAGRDARVRGSRPGGQQTFFESVATPNGVLLVTERFPLSGPYENPVSGVLVLRAPTP